MQNNLPTKKLNAAQEEAVSHVKGPLLIVAGAGTGKTTVLVERIIRLLASGAAKLDQILMLTFTEKAAGELEDRVLKTLPYGSFDAPISTFHSFCEKLLRDRGLDMGLPADFKLLTESEQWIFFKRNIDAFDLDYYRPLGNPTKFIHELLRHFSRLKDENIQPEEYLAFADGLELDLDRIPDSKSRNKNQGSKQRNKKTGLGLEKARIIELAGVYHRYNQLLLDNGSLDFGDLICYSIELFKKRPNILGEYRSRYQFLMVDEFQDTNWAQYELVKMLSAPENNLAVVGDDDQAIYKFRGASLSNIMQFKEDYPSCREVVMRENFRSGKLILDASYRFIRNNDPNRLEASLGINKALISTRESDGSVRCLRFNTRQNEALFAAAAIREIKSKDEDVQWRDFAVLARSNDTAAQFASELVRASIPVGLVSQRGLYLKPAVVDVLSYLKLLDNYHESSSLYRILTLEPFAIGHSEIVALNYFARRKLWSLYDAVKQAEAVRDISPASVLILSRLRSLIEKHSKIAETSLPSRLFLEIYKDLDFARRWDRDRDSDKFSLMHQLYARIKDFEMTLSDARLKDLMEYFTLEAEAGETGPLNAQFEDDNTVRVMTVHAAKGLEFKHVFVVDLVDKKFPTVARSEKIPVPDVLVREKLPEGSSVHLEEERRLFYVAMTRAKDTLVLTCARDCNGAREKKPSRFLQEAGFGDPETVQGKSAANELETDLKALEITNSDNCRERFNLPDKFSFSQLEAYSNCPLQYKFNFLLRIPVPEKPALSFGRTMHSALKDLFLHTIYGMKAQSALFEPATDTGAPPRPTIAQAFAIFDKHWSDSGYMDKRERDEYRKKGREILKGLIARMESEGWPETRFLEKSFTVRIGSHYFKGAIDRIDRISETEVGIVDYKTGQPKDDLEFENKRQLILYKVAVEQGMGMKAGKLSYYYLENNTPVSFSAGEKDIARLFEFIDKNVRGIESCDFTPSPGPLCKYCDFKDICEFRK